MNSIVEILIALNKCEKNEIGMFLIERQGVPKDVKVGSRVSQPAGRREKQGFGLAIYIHSIIVQWRGQATAQRRFKYIKPPVCLKIIDSQTCVDNSFLQGLCKLLQQYAVFRRNG